jgi:uncharacterized protein
MHSGRRESEAVARKGERPSAGPAPVAGPSGSLEFVEYASEDPGATRRFLEVAFDWRFRIRPMPAGEYLAAEAPGGGRGGIRPTRPTEAPSSLSYIRVADLAKALERVQSAGGAVVLPRVDVPGMGSFFWFRAPGGPVIACWQDAPPEPKKE